MDSPKEQMTRLLVAVHTRTKNKELDWIEVEGSSNRSIIAAVGSNSVKLAYFAYKNGASSMLDMKLSVYNSSGIETDSIRDTEMKGIPSPSGFPGWYAFMQDIHDLASRQLLGSDETLNEVFKDLGV